MKHIDIRPLDLSNKAAKILKSIIKISQMVKELCWISKIPKDLF